MKNHSRRSRLQLFFGALFAFTITTSANAALVSRLNGQAVYDTDLNITWLTNANLAATNTFGLPTNVDLGGIPGLVTTGGSYIYIDHAGDTDGTMTWGGALHWVAAMNASNYLGYSDWRLPTTSDVCTGCAGGEMGHLFSELGGVLGTSITTTHNTNYSLFQNLGYPFWTGNDSNLEGYVPNTYTTVAWMSYLGNGYQDFVSKDQPLQAFAVRSGDVAAVPLPAAFWLFGSGIIGLLRFKQQRPDAAATRYSNVMRSEG